MIYGQRKNFFELKQVFLIKKNCLWSKEIDLFTLKKQILNQQNFLQWKEIFSLTVYQRNVSLIQRNCFPGVNQWTATNSQWLFTDGSIYKSFTENQWNSTDESVK